MPAQFLYLCTTPALIRQQLAGQALSPTQQTQALADLRDDISTDEITPLPCLVHFDDTLGRHPYTGVKVGGECPIKVDAVRGLARSGAAIVTVAGLRYGKGSSREHSPVAERAAGVGLVIAKSFERLYRQNADNIGLLTSTDFGLIDRLNAGAALADLMDEIVAGRDALSAAIVRAGGLLAYGRRVQLRGTDAALPAGAGSRHAPPQTYFDKIIARRAVGNPDGLFVRAHWRFIHEYYTGMAAHLLRQAFGGGRDEGGDPGHRGDRGDADAVTVMEPHSVIVFEDHMTYAAQSPAHVSGGLLPNVRAMVAAQQAFADRHGLVVHRTDAAGTTRNAGISHAMVIEHYALPGQVVVGTDSHTPHSGAVGCAAFGVGTTDMANAFVTGCVRLTQPQTLQVQLNGRLALGVTAKDVVLALLARPDIRAGLGIGRVFEFVGEALTALSTDERATLCNMTAELGGLTGIVIPDAETVRFLRERRGVDFVLEDWMCSDPGAVYAQVISVDCSALSPWVALPGDPGRGLPLADLSPSERRAIRPDIAYGGSCTAGKREDFDHYHAVLKWAADRGLRVPASTTLYLQFGTTAVRDYCTAQGYLATFAAVGAVLLEPSCGACANCGPGSSTDAAQVTVSAINRNFPGRSGPGSVYLTSPPTVAASAIAGYLCSFEELRKLASKSGHMLKNIDSTKYIYIKS